MFSLICVSSISSRILNCVWSNRRDYILYIEFDRILAHKDAFRLKNDADSRQCARLHTRHVTHCLRRSGTCYISHSRWYDDVTRRCVHSAHPVLSLITIYRFWSVANGAFWNFTKFFAFSFAWTFCTAEYLFNSLVAELWCLHCVSRGKLWSVFLEKKNLSIKRTIAFQIYFYYRRDKLILNLIVTEYTHVIE